MVAMFFYVACVCANGQESAIPWDSAGRIYVIDVDMESKVGLFPSIEGFIEARLFKVSDSTFSLEVFSARDGKQERTRKEISFKEMSELLAKFRERLGARAPQMFLNQEGRSAVLWGSAIWSLIYYAPMITVAIDPSSGNLSDALPFLIAPVLGYFVPAALTHNASVTEGTASLCLGGMFQGAMHGWALALLFQGDDIDQKFGAAMSVGVGITESVLGFVIAKDNDLNEAHAGVINTTMFYGSVIGLFSGFLAGSDANGIELDSRVAGSVAIAGAAAGAVVGNMIGKAGGYSPADAGIYATTGLLGATLPMAVFAVTSIDDPRIFFGAAIVSTVGGLFVGDRIAQGRDYQSSLIPVLSTVGGGLFGAGIGLLIGDGNAVPLCTWGGAAIGFAISVAKADTKVNGKWRDHSGLHFSVNPTAFAFAALNSTSNSTVSMPLASVSYTFK